MFPQNELRYVYCPACANRLQKKPIENKDRLFCDKCGFIFWKNPKPTTSIILEKEGKVLLIKRSKEPFKNYWVLPGGYVEYDEDPRSTIEREVKEETGLEVAVDEVVSVYLIDTDPRGNSIDIVYKGSILGGQLNLEEHSQYRFFPPKDLPDLMAYKHRDVIVQYNRG